MKSLRRIKKAGWHATGTTEVVGVVANGGWKENELGLTSCEDSSVVRFFDSSGKDVTPHGDRRYVQALRVVKRKGRWKVSEAITAKVTNFEGRPCAGLARCIVGHRLDWNSRLDAVGTRGLE